MDRCNVRRWALTVLERIFANREAMLSTKLSEARRRALSMGGSGLSMPGRLAVQ